MPTFREYRLQSGLSLGQLARNANVDYKTAKRAEDGKPLHTLKAIALVKALSAALGEPLTVEDIERMEVTY